MPQRTEVLLVYLAGLAQGLALVTFPAASSIFTSPHGYGLSASRYGLMFIPQVILAILASSLGPALAQRWSLKQVLQAGLSANFLAMTLLAFSSLLQAVSGRRLWDPARSHWIAGLRLRRNCHGLEHLCGQNSFPVARTAPYLRSMPCSAPAPLWRRSLSPSSSVWAPGGCCR